MGKTLKENREELEKKYGPKEGFAKYIDLLFEASERVKQKDEK